MWDYIADKWNLLKNKHWRGEKKSTTKPKNPRAIVFITWLQNVTKLVANNMPSLLSSNLDRQLLCCCARFVSQWYHQSVSFLEVWHLNISEDLGLSTSPSDSKWSLLKYSSLPDLCKGVQVLQGVLTGLLCLSFPGDEQEGIMVAQKETGMKIKH